MTPNEQLALLEWCISYEPGLLAFPTPTTPYDQMEQNSFIQQVTSGTTPPPPTPSDGWNAWTSRSGHTGGGAIGEF